MEIDFAHALPTPVVPLVHNEAAGNSPRPILNTDFKYGFLMEEVYKRASIKRPITCPLNTANRFSFSGGDKVSIPVRDASHLILPQLEAIAGRR
jgi:hypothetical protein